MEKAEPPQWMASASGLLTDKLVVEEVNTGQWNYSYSTDPAISDLMRAADAVRSYICHYRLEEALKVMSDITGFERNLESFIFSRCQHQAAKVKSQPDKGGGQMCLQDLQRYTTGQKYKEFLSTTPLLASAVYGSMSNDNFQSIQDPVRSGFGGSRRSDKIDMKPAIVQIISTCLHHKHPRCVTEVQAINALLLTTAGAPGVVQGLQNQLGSCLSRATTNKALTNIIADKDHTVKQWRDGIQKMWSECSSQIRRRTLACSDSPGYVLAGDNVGKGVYCRHNCGLANMNRFIQMTLTLAVKNRVATSHLSDAPTVDPMTVDMEPGPDDLQTIKAVMQFTLGRQAAHHPRLRQFSRCARYPEFQFAAKMQQKSEVVVLGAHLDDPANRAGMKKVLGRLQPLAPLLDTSSGRCQKTLIIGDHGFSAIASKVIENMCDEEKPGDRCEGLITLPAEWHKKKLDLEMYYRYFYSESMVTVPGTPPNIKSSFHHPQVTADAKNYYASYDLLKITNTVNLFVLIDQILEDRQIAPLHQITELEFHEVLEEVWTRINLMGRWREAAAWGEEKKDDEELMWRYDNLWTSSLFLAQKEATTRGHGAALVSFWKNSMGDYQLQHNTNYKRQAVRRILANAGVYGQKVRMDALHNALVNNKGLPNSNVEMDLVVEHHNKVFKERLEALGGRYTEEAIERIGASLTLGDMLQEKLYPTYQESGESTARRVSLGSHNETDFWDQVAEGALMAQGCFTYTPGRGSGTGYLRKDRLDRKALKKYCKSVAAREKLYVSATFKDFA